LYKKNSKLPIKEQMFWNLAFVRSIYGTIGTIGCIYERWFDRLGPQSIDDKTVLSYALTLAHLGFFVFECSAQTYFDFRFKTFSKELHIHHLLALAGYTFVAAYDVNHYHGCSVFILEMSTPLR
jgi:ceroid-lipofuscinosis protein 8